MTKHKTFFDTSLFGNMTAWNTYVDQLTELSVSMFEWKNLPEGVNVRYLEKSLFARGAAAFFYDEGLDDYLALPITMQGQLDLYGDPTSIRAYGVNGYSVPLHNHYDAVIIWNNYLKMPSYEKVLRYAMRLYDLDRTIDVNARAQKTPVAIVCDEHQRLTFLNLFKEVDGNAPVIFGSKNLDLNNIKALNLNAPFVADKLYDLKTAIWNEALTYLGISNVNVMKSERLNVPEVQGTSGGVIANRYSRLQARREAAEEINKLFGLNVEVNYREDYAAFMPGEKDATTGDPEGGEETYE